MATAAASGYQVVLPETSLMVGFYSGYYDYAYICLYLTVYFDGTSWYLYGHHEKVAFGQKVPQPHRVKPLDNFNQDLFKANPPQTNGEQHSLI